MNSKFIQSAVQKYLYDKSNVYQALNYAKSGYYESDILGVTPSMIVTECEVKISMSDFKADFKKTEKHLRLQNPIHDKHRSTPNRFFYACPKGMIDISLIPTYAGLIYVDERGVVELIKQAPVLHKNKATNKLIIGMLNQLTQKSIYGGICKLTHDNNILKEKHDRYQLDKQNRLNGL